MQNGTYIDGKKYLTALEVEEIYNIKYRALRYHKAKGHIQSYYLKGYGTTDFFLPEEIVELLRSHTNKKNEK